MRTPQERVAFFREHAAESATWTRTHITNANWANAAVIGGSAARSYLAAALFAWRQGLADPRPDLAASVSISDEVAEAIRSPRATAIRPVFDAAPGAYAAFVMDKPTSLVVDEGCWYVGFQGAHNPRDKPLDARLISALAGRGALDGPGMAELYGRRRGMALLGRSFTTYFQLAACAIEDVERAMELTKAALADYALRSRDAYFQGGYLWEGDEERLMVDIRLAAIWRARDWDPSALTAEQRSVLFLP